MSQAFGGEFNLKTESTNEEPGLLIDTKEKATTTASFSVQIRDHAESLTVDTVQEQTLNLLSNSDNV